MPNETADAEVTWELSGPWFVWSKQGHRPRFAHQSREAAEREAERLARLNPGTKFHLVQSIAKVISHKPILPDSAPSPVEPPIACAEERAEATGTDPIDERAADEDAALEAAS